MTIHRTLLTCVLVLGASRGMAQPVAAILISPSADVVGSNITFTWQSAPGATWYQFWLGKADTSLITDHWYTAEHSGCAAGGTCAIALTPPITAGAFIWHIRTWSSSGYGPWSPAHMFTVRDVVQSWSGLLPPSRRFTLVMNNAAVLDNETGLVWQRTVGPPVEDWEFAWSLCVANATGGRRGWRMPTVSELQSLIEPGASNPALPAGHPFVSAIGEIWTLTEHPSLVDYHYRVNLDSGFTGVVDGETPHLRSFCVRGGSSPE